MVKWNFTAIGTSWQIDIYSDITEDTRDLVYKKVQDRIEVFDKNYSRFRSDSLVTMISKEIGIFTLPEDAKIMFDLYKDLYEKTGGLFTPLIGNLISDAGYDANYSLKQNKKLEKSPKWSDVLKYKYPRLRVEKPVILDFGAAGKGYLIDIVASVLEENSIKEYCIDAGGDILHKGSKPIRIGLENPNNTNEALGIVNLQNSSICGSAGNRRAWGDFTHIINPETLRSPRDIIAIWVMSKTALIADAIATCLFFVEAETLKTYDFEFLIVYKDYTINKSKGFTAELFIS